jgi:hypothetical protein
VVIYYVVSDYIGFSKIITRTIIIIIIIKIKVKFNLEQTTKAQRGSRGIAILFP